MLATRERLKLLIGLWTWIIINVEKMLATRERLKPSEALQHQKALV